MRRTSKDPLPTNTERRPKKDNKGFYARFTNLALVMAFVVGVLASFAVNKGVAIAAETADTVPFKTSAEVGCTWSNGCDDGYHGYKAIDFGLPQNTPIYAAGPGTVGGAGGCDNTNSTTCNGSAGNYVEITHPDGRVSRYLHLKKEDLKITGNAQRGTMIGRVGMSGWTTFSHLHYEEKNSSGTKVDPGIMKASVGGVAKEYPADLGNYDSWDDVPAHSNKMVVNDSYGATSYANGTFLRASDTGKVYVVAGGAPMYVSNWANVGGQQTINYTVTQAAINAMPDYPTNGTFIRDGVTNKVYRIAGGSAMYVQNWANVGGQQASVKVDGWVLTNQLLQYPTNGTFITDGTNGKVYVVAGGSALYVSNWNYVGGQQSSVTVDPWVLTNKLLAYPLDGTFIRDGSNNKVYRIAGGSAMYVQNWANVGGQQTAVLVDPAVFTNELLNYPADGTFIRDGSNGKVYVVAGGAPLYVSDWANVGGQQAATTIDPWVFTNKLLTYPMDGTLVKGYVSQDEYQIVSQAAVYIADPGQVSGPRVIVDDWAIDNQLLAQ